MISMKIALVHILRRFRFSTEENIEDSKFHYHATLSRVGGYPVCIEKRHWETRFLFKLDRMQFEYSNNTHVAY